MGRDLVLKSENGPSFSFSFSFSFSLPRSFGCCADSAKCAADGETVGETASNLPSRSDEAELRLFDVSLSFLRGKTFDKKEAMTREKPVDLTSVVVGERRGKGQVGCPDKVEVVKSIAGDAPRPVATFPCRIRQQATARVMVCTQHLS